MTNNINDISLKISNLQTIFDLAKVTCKNEERYSSFYLKELQNRVNAILKEIAEKRDISFIEDILERELLFNRVYVRNNFRQILRIFKNRIESIDSLEIKELEYIIDTLICGESWKKDFPGFAENLEEIEVKKLIFFEYISR